MDLEALFRACIGARYRHVENAGDYAIDRTGDSVRIFFEGSNGAEDWLNNFDFPAKAYEDMGAGRWFAHRGFLSVWKAIEPYIAPTVVDLSVGQITVVGFSHGAALAVLCHEYVWYHRPDLRDRLTGYGFGCPRVIWGMLTPRRRARWETFTVVRNLDDIVTHVPPSAIGYTHVGTLLEIGTRGRYSSVDAHRPENYIRELSDLSP